MKSWLENKYNYGRQYRYEHILALAAERIIARDPPLKQAAQKMESNTAAAAAASTARKNRINPLKYVNFGIPKKSGKSLSSFVTGEQTRSPLQGLGSLS